jgi:DNA modification methylase
VVLYNFGYSIENPALPYKLVAAIVDSTEFALVDTVFWKKTTGMPFPANSKRLSRIVDFVWVFARKSEISTYKNGRRVVKVSPRGQKYYNVVYNFLEAKNSDIQTPLNQATFSQELVSKLLDMYASQDTELVFDPFSGTGTTLLASVKKGYDCIGSEISDKQCDLAKERLKKECIADI